LLEPNQKNNLQGGEKMRYNSFPVFGVGVLLVLIASAPSFAAEPDGTVKITGKSVAAGVGYS
jgi:hypothetical protein